MVRTQRRAHRRGDRRRHARLPRQSLLRPPPRTPSSGSPTRWRLTCTPTAWTALAVTPGFLRSEAVLDSTGRSRRQTGGTPSREIRTSPSPRRPCFVGRAVAALAAESARLGEEQAGLYSSWELAREYRLHRSRRPAGRTGATSSCARCGRSSGGTRRPNDMDRFVVRSRPVPGRARRGGSRGGCAPARLARTGSGESKTGLGTERRTGARRTGYNFRLPDIAAGNGRRSWPGRAKEE